MIRGSFKDTLFISVSVALLFFITPSIDSCRHSFLSKKGIPEKDLLYRILGEGKKILSVYTDLKSDEYLHGGVVPKDRKACFKVNVENALKDRFEHRHDDIGTDHEFHRQGKRTITVSRLNVLAYLGEAIHLGKHIHIHGAEEKELLPWFYYAARLDHNNVDAYVNAGHWLGIRLGRPDEAIRFLKEGLRYNPDSWQIYFQLGEVYFTAKKDYEEALINFRQSSKRLTEKNSDKYDKRKIYTFMAACYEEVGNILAAVRLYKKIIILFPHDPSLRKKLDALSSLLQ